MMFIKQHFLMHYW